jgi:hypothetical protein
MTDKTVCLMGVAGNGTWSIMETAFGAGHPIGGVTSGRLDFSNFDDLVRDVDYITWETDTVRSFDHGRVRGFMEAAAAVLGNNRVHTVSASRRWQENEGGIWWDNSYEQPRDEHDAALLAWCGWADVFEPRLFGFERADGLAEPMTA